MMATCLALQWPRDFMFTSVPMLATVPAFVVLFGKRSPGFPGAAISMFALAGLMIFGAMYLVALGHAFRH
jgi:hypothetical protein